MQLIDRAIKDFKTTIQEMTFSEAIRGVRDRIGLRQYRAAEFMNMSLGRLVNLETGYFRIMPTDLELLNICKFYDLPLEEIKKKAEKHVKRRKKQRFQRTITDNSICLKE